MGYQERISLYEQIEEIRGRPLVAFVTSLRSGKRAAGMIASDVIPELIRQLQTIPDNENKIDVLIVSNGGDPIVPWRITSMLRERFEEIAVLVPYVAYSAATLLALGADEIVMHPYSNLGPVDPQLSAQRQIPGQDTFEFKFGAEDLRYFLEFVREDVGISDQEELAKAFELLCGEVGSTLIGAAKRSSELTLSLGEQLLNQHMKDSSKTASIAEALNRSFYAHNFTLGRAQAKEIGLPVTEPDEQEKELLWAVWQDISDEMQCDVPFNPVEILFSSEQVADQLTKSLQVNIPGNLPPAAMQQAYQAALQQIQIVEVPPVDYELIHAVLESLRGRSEYKSAGKITAVRLPDSQIKTNRLAISQGWAYYPSDNDATEAE